MNLADAPPAAPRDRSWWLAALAALALWAPSIGGAFLYDDLGVIVANRSIRDLSALSTVLRTEPSRPLLNFTWALNYAWTGLSPWSYHLVNVALHAGNAALLATVLGWILRRAGRSETALVPALLFAVTPMAAETVAYVASRSTALSALFILASLRCALPCLEASGRRGAALALFGLGLLTKEEAASMPLYLLLIDLYFVARFDLRALCRRAGLHAAFFALPLLGLIGRRWVTGSWLPAPAIDLGTYLLTQAAAFPLYWGRSLFPLDPALYREHPPASWPPDALAAGGLLVAASLVAMSLAGRHRWPFWSFSVPFLAAGLTPSSTLVPLAEMVVDHRAYLGGAAVLLAAGLALARAPRLVTAAVVLGLAAWSLRAQWILADPARTWEEALRRAPDSAVVLTNLADVYLARKDPRAEGALLRTVQVAPHNAQAWSNLGTFFAGAGRQGQAAWALSRAVQAGADARVRCNYAQVLLALGRPAEALVQLRQAAGMDPTLAAPRIELARLAAREGDHEGARMLLAEAMRLEIDPQDAEAIQSVEALLAHP